MERMRKRARIAAILVIALSLLTTGAAAASAPLWSTMRDTTAVMYIPNPGGETTMTAQVGTVNAADVQQTPLSELDTPVRTTILLDNSLSMPEPMRPVVREVIDDIIGKGMEKEQFTIATFSQDVNYLCQNVSKNEFEKLQQAMDNIEYIEQNTYLTDIIYTLLKNMQGNDDDVLRRLIIIADGADDKSAGVTKEEVIDLMKEVRCPIYTVGCTNDNYGNDELLKNFFAFSRVSTGESFLLDDTKPMDIAIAISGFNEALKVEITVPPEACDGATKGIQLNVEAADGSVNDYKTELNMPFVDLPEPTPVWMYILIALGVVLVIVLIVLVVVMKKKKRFEYLPTDNSPNEDAATEVMEKTEINQDATALIWEAAPAAVATKKLILTDVDNPVHRYEVPLQGTIAIGRDPAKCKIVINFDPSISRHQCDIKVGPEGGAMIMNRSASNITLLNGREVAEPCGLADGSVIKIGRLTMKVEIQ